MAATLSQPITLDTTVQCTEVLASPRDIQVKSACLPLQDIHKYQQLPARHSSPETGQKRVRRKPSSFDLAQSARPRTGPALARAWTPTLNSPSDNHLHQNNNKNAAPAPSHQQLQQDHHHPVTPRPRVCASSPSLSSTITTIQSTPTQTPIYRGGCRLQHTSGEEVDAFGEPIRTKRNFDSLRRAKRLPHQAFGSRGGSSSRDEGEVWQVLAVVLDGPAGRITRDIAAEQEASAFVRETAALRKGRSVRFHGVCSEHSQKQIEGDEEPAETSGTSDNKGASSSLSLLKRGDWPLPPSRDNWTGAFDHPAEADPSPTPATILYRGASFDVLNPHASLLLGPRELETPAEIDGLLDSYFEDRHDDMQYDTFTGEPAKAVPRIPSENSKRDLYDDVNTARRNILRVEEDAPPMPPKAMLKHHDSRRRVLSDPFDLTLSESGSHDCLVHPDGAHRPDDTSASRMKAHGLGISDLDDTHATSEPSTDPTIKEILKAYDYTRPLSDPPREAELHSSPEIEQGRKTGPELSYTSSNGLMTPVQTPASERFGSATAFRAQEQPYVVTPSLPTPPARVYTGQHYHSGCVELPTSDQTYGETNQLLLITPEAPTVLPPYSTSTPCHPKTCTDPSHIHVNPRKSLSLLTPTTNGTLLHEEADDASIDSVECTRSLVELAIGVDEADKFIFGLEDDAAGDIGRCIPRSSSFYPDDGEGDWVTEYAGSQQDLRRFSKDSYANTSFYGSQFRLSIGPPKTASMPLSPILDSSPVLQNRGFLLREKITKAVADAKLENRRQDTQDRIKALESKICKEDHELELGARTNTTKIERKADLAELQHLRQLFPPIDRCIAKAPEPKSSLVVAARDKYNFNPFSKPNFHAKTSLTRMLGLIRQDSGFNSASDTRGLLASPTPSPMANNLGFSESTGTFVTVQQESPLNVRGAATQLWSPFDKDPTSRAMYISSPLRVKNAPNEIEMRAISTKSLRSKRAAISAQYEPRDLHLIKSKRMTDRELMAREPGWVNHPSERGPGATPIQRYGCSVSSGQRMLLKPETVIEQALREEQKRISKRYAYACAAFPPLALAFACGAFDKTIAKATAGNVTKASFKEKRNSLIVFFPLGTIVWIVVIIAIFVMVTLSKDAASQRSHGSPFGSR